MTRYCYWKSTRPKEEIKPFEGRSGWCPADKVPAHAIALEEDLPTEISVEIDESCMKDGEPLIRLASPVVFGPSNAFRYRASFYRSEILDTKFEKKMFALHDFRKRLDAMFIKGPEGEVTRENWWWANKDRYWQPCERIEGVKEPIRLLKKWAGPMLEIMTEGHPQQDEILAEWESNVTAYDRSQRENSDSTERTRDKNKYGQKTEGILVCCARPHRFASGRYFQLFELRKFGSGNRLGPHAGNTRFRTPHRDMQPICDAWLEDAGVAAPMAYAALLAKRTVDLDRQTSGHAYIQTLARTRKDIKKWSALAEEWLSQKEADALAGKVETKDIHVLEATINAMTIFCRDIISPASLREQSGLPDTADALFLDRVKNLHKVLEQVLDAARHEAKILVS